MTADEQRRLLGEIENGVLALVLSLPGKHPAAELSLALQEMELYCGLIRKALEEPLRWIAENAGIDGSIVIDKVTHAKGANGFNALTETYEDLLKAGVIDPTKVVRTALQNAASVASLLLTTEAMVAEKPEENGGGGGGMPGGGMPGGMPGMM